jgi:hypothetical protein
MSVRIDNAIASSHDVLLSSCVDHGSLPQMLMGCEYERITRSPHGYSGMPSIFGRSNLTGYSFFTDFTGKTGLLPRISRTGSSEKSVRDANMKKTSW